MRRTRRRNSEKNGRRGNGNGRGRYDNGRRSSQDEFEPARPDDIEFVPCGDAFLCVGRWEDSDQWSYIGRTEDDEDSDIFRSYDGDEIPDHVPALVAAAGLYLNGDNKLSSKTRSKLETFVSKMEESGYGEAA